MNDIIASRIENSTNIHLTLNEISLNKEILLSEDIYFFNESSGDFEVVALANVKSITIKAKVKDVEIKESMFQLLLDSFPEIERLALRNVEVSNYKVVYQFKNLKYINFYFKPSANFDFTCFSELSELSIYYYQEFKSIFSCSGIKILRLVNFKENKVDLSGNFSQLEELEIRQSNFEEILGITELSTLKSVEIADNRKLNTIVFLKNCQKIESLRIVNSPKILDFEPISSLQKLRSLHLENVKELDNLEFLKNLKNLE